MKTEINYSQAPGSYLVCLKKDCSQANTCLRQLAEQSIPSNIQAWNIVSPKYLASLEGNCPYYRSSTKVRFAKGLINILENLPHKQMRTVVLQLSRHFGQRSYYRVRKGERLLSPYEQKAVQNILKRCEVSHPQDFDAYIEEYDW